MKEEIIFESNLIGPKGENGITPTIGDNGNWYLGDADTGKSSRGLQGLKGEKGEQGDIGPQGIQGLQGERGEKGEQGERGEQGQTGPANTLTIGSVTKGDDASATITGESPNQVINLVLPKGEKGDQGEQGIQGPQGEQGHTPVAGVDYFTEQDKKEINATNKEYIDSLFGNVNEILSTLTEVAE